jgi:outer membrane receptor for ferrienterochelin and colicins
MIRFATGLSVLLTLIVFAAVPATAQSGAIAGQITDAETMAPLAGARVEATGAGGSPRVSAVTDASGRYRLSGLSAGRYTVVVGSLAYETHQVDRVEVADDMVTDVSVSLSSHALRLNPVVVSASRRAERILDAPASVTLVDSRSIAERPALTPIDHVRSAPGVDVITTGIQSTNVVARGFNNIFSGALFMLTDHRIAGVPSLRVNLLHFVPVYDEDIGRMEVVLGPAAALYGPGTASGVLHIFTKSPLDEPGSTLSFAGGERDVFQGTFRTAHAVNERFGIKLSGQYLRGQEWPHVDATEASERAFCDANPQFCQMRIIAAEDDVTPAEASARVARIGLRDEGIERFGGEIRADWRPTPATNAILSVGTSNTRNAVELTGLGAGQVKDWSYSYYQARLTHNRFFGQAYLNTSNAGDTYLLRNGAPIVDRSRLLVSQLQHGFELTDRQSFTYGIDLLHTMPDTEGTIHGRHEDDDVMTEVGGYLHSETNLSRNFDLILAGRVDGHSHLDGALFSPRAALVFRPDENHNFRATFNRGLSTPSAINLFLDLGTPFPTEAAALAQLGYSVRVQGTLDGIRLRGADGGWQMRSPFSDTLLTPHSPTMWQDGVNVLYAASAFGPPASAEAQQMRLFLLSQTPVDPTVIGINTWNVGTGQRGRLADLDIPDIPQIRESTNYAVELGYKGLLGGRVLIATDVWYERKQDFVTPLMMQTPFLLLDSASVHAYLAPRFQAIGQPEAAAAALAGGMARLPLGVISSEEVYGQGAQALMTYRNFGEVNLWGADIALRAELTESWSLGLAGSLVNRDHFFSEGQFIALNAPKHKAMASIGHRRPSGFHGEMRARYTGAFPAFSGVYFGAECVSNAPADLRRVPCVDSHTLLDLTLGHRLPAVPGASVQLAVQNLLDTSYRSFAGVPEIGRMALLRVAYEF